MMAMRQVETVLCSGLQISEAETFLTRVEAAAYLRCSVPTMDRWARLGTGPRFRMIGRRALYALSALRAFAGVEASLPR